MANINRVTITGNLTRDPELRTTQGGLSICKLGVAVNHRRKDNSTGQWIEEPNFFDVTVFGSQGENCATYLSKGRPVAVDGRLAWSSWEQDGQKRSKVEIIANIVQFLGARDDAGGGGGGGGGYGNGNGGATGGDAQQGGGFPGDDVPEPAPVGTGEDDEIPF
jgi:single-strand DNA-binding protein